jgi:macrolide-specific efflux system membrane fusion protein
MVEITYDEREDVVQVPAMAVTTADGTSTVTVRSDDGDEESAVDTGLTSGSMVEITSGLEAGEQVVVTVPGARGGGGPDGGPPAFSAGSDSEEAP